jgi:Arc/MetJ-type ribon-helix-helix transcriptional regulator
MPRIAAIPLTLLHVRLPTEFAERLDADVQRLGISKSDALRQYIVLDQKPVAEPRSKRRPPASPADPKLLRELRMIGVNLNQIARSLNEIKLVNATSDGIVAIDAFELRAELRSIKAAIERLEP